MSKHAERLLFPKMTIKSAVFDDVAFPSALETHTAIRFATVRYRHYTTTIVNWSKKGEAVLALEGAYD